MVPIRRPVSQAIHNIDRLVDSVGRALGQFQGVALLSQLWTSVTQRSSWLEIGAERRTETTNTGRMSTVVPTSPPRPTFDPICCGFSITLSETLTVIADRVCEVVSPGRCAT